MDRNNIVKLFNEASDLFNKNYHKQSLDILNQISEFGNYIEVYKLMIKIYLIYENYHKAYKLISKIIQNYPDLNNYTSKYNIIKKINNIDLFEELLDELPNNEEYNDLKSKVKSHLSKYYKSVQHLINKKEWLENSYHIKLNEYSALTNEKPTKILIDAKKEFRYFCYNYLDLIRNQKIPEIIQTSEYATVLIEFRKLPHIEFLIRNTILKLGTKWCHTVVCGNINYDWVKDICSKISPNLNIVKLNYDNLSVSEYSKLLASKYFWNLFNSDKILLYQEDTCIFKSNIDEFLDYDYIGAPWPKSSNINKYNVGNGGFSLRSKKIMIEVIEKINIFDVKYTQKYIDTPAEDIYFTKVMSENNIGKIADMETAYKFSHESLINNNSFGGHCFFLYNKKWKELLWENIIMNLLN